MGEWCCPVQNHCQNRSGYYPMQRVFGFTQHLSATLLSDDPIDPECLSTDPIEDIHRAAELRRAAMKAWTAMNSRIRLLRDDRARHRIPPAFTGCQLVFVWRQGLVRSGKWFGPAVIILPTAGGAWIHMRSTVACV
eukprot:8049375-Pyramimonas_sp.AAC.1